MQYINDPFLAGRFADGIGHPVRVMIVRILRDSGALSIKAIQKALRDTYDYEIPYSTLVAHVRKLVFAGICEEQKINNMNGVKLVKSVEVVIWEK